MSWLTNHLVDDCDRIWDAKKFISLCGGRTTVRGSPEIENIGCESYALVGDISQHSALR